MSLNHIIKRNIWRVLRQILLTGLSAFFVAALPYITANLVDLVSSLSEKMVLNIQLCMLVL